MVADGAWVLPLSAAGEAGPSSVGGKAANLWRLAKEGFRVPGGFCVPVASYERFVSEARLQNVVGMELGRKPFAEMRWEEIWDAALRIRSAFARADIPGPIAEAIRHEVSALGPGRPLAVRSSAPDEDSAGRSFAGLHESHLDVVGAEAVLDAIRRVWSSLWSDAALLYRKELDLDPSRSRMAVVVQEIVTADRSGVAFGRDPREPTRDRAIIEAVAGPCSRLVDGHLDPDRWVLRRPTGEIVQWKPGERPSPGPASPLLDARELHTLYRCLQAVESACGWPPDVEWTGTGERLTLLQARPITGPMSPTDDEREWYLSLRPDADRLAELSRRVSEDLIPELQRQGDELAAEAIESLDDADLSSTIARRLETLRRWKKVYWDEFIPLAHGVRHLAVYYNDAVRPRDPYEFVGLLQGTEMLATQRNRALRELASRLAGNPALMSAGEIARARTIGGSGGDDLGQRLREVPGGPAFLQELERFQRSFMDISFAGERLTERGDSLWALLLEMARSSGEARTGTDGPAGEAPDVEQLERRLFDAVGEDRHREAAEVLRIARLSWTLRDDDNLLLARVESQLLRALNLAAARLRQSGRLSGREPREGDAPELMRALRDPEAGRLELAEGRPEETGARASDDATPRQLVGQPAAPGFGTGRVKRVRSAEDLARFRAGEVLVCDAIQPNMTHLVPLAAGIVERRGGMLIHGAIIARELGIPCVNGVPRAADVLGDGDLVTVDGHLGIVTVGATDFELERAFAESNP
jgi:pyruvate,water dikinase